VARERRLVEYEYRLGSKQRPDYGLGKCRYLNGEGCKRQLDDRKQEQEADQKKNKYRPSRDELPAEPITD
jgi:hypothetical protein